MVRLFFITVTFVFTLFAGQIAPHQLFDKTFALSGTFHPYTFYPPENPKSAFNWVFKTPAGNVYQMMGTTPSQDNVFGWKKIEISRLSPAVWDFYYIGDLDGDGDTRFDFILTASDRTSKVYKLLPVPVGSFFEYQDLGYIDYQKDPGAIHFGREAVRYLGLFDSLQDPGLPKSAAIVDSAGLRDFIERYHPAFADKLEGVDLKKYNIAIFSFTLSGGERIRIEPPRFIASKVVAIPTIVQTPEVGILSVVYYSFVVVTSKEIERVVFELKGKEIIVNFSSVAVDCSDEPQVSVCGLKQIQCVTTPCEPIAQTYPSYCALKNDGAKYLHMGPCDQNITTNPAAIAKSVAKLSGDLMHKLYADRNILISPFSIFSALDMVYLGAAGETKEEFERVLGFEPGIDVPSSMRLYLDSVSPKANRLEVANSAWFEKEFKVYRSYEEMVRDFLYSEVFRKDFIHDYDNVRKEINRWVEQKTHDKIKDLLPPRSLSPQTRAVLVNAVYFLGEWMYAFDQNDTKQEPFTLMDGSQKMVPMMNIVGEFALSAMQNFEALELPYRAAGKAADTPHPEGELSMWILLPKEGKRIEDVLCEVCDNGIEPIVQNRWYAQDLEVKLPKFRFEWGTEDLVQALKASGLRRVFDRNQAQLDYLGEPIDPNGRLYVSSVFHKTFIEVNEKGSEAAAATAAVVTEVTGMMEPMRFYVDRPFVFMITENRYHSPLFYGVVVEP